MPPDQEETEEDVPVTDKEEVTPESETESKGSVKIPEDFQRQASAFVDGCSDMPCLDFVQSLISDKRMELSKSEEPESFDTEDMPKS